MKKLFIVLLVIITFVSLSIFFNCNPFDDGAQNINSSDLDVLDNTDLIRASNGDTCIAILKSYGVSRLRLRNWTRSGWCDTSHNQELANRWGGCSLLSVHFSDSWADPGKQTIPSGWPTDYNSLRSKVTSYMQSTISAGVKQIGNETNNGLLWPVGKADTNPSQYAGLVAAGKAGGGSLVHISNGQDYSLHSWNFGILSSNGVSVSKGMSIYGTGNLSAAQSTASRMGGGYTVCEIGCERFASGAASFINGAKSIGTVYYWEPEAQGYQGYTWDACDPATHKFTDAITSGRPHGADISWLLEMEAAGYTWSY
ncbi:MAG: glycosyl hydrolase 53 family protein [Spirochaetes bacterium]|nr:glycosyl hydrolase 53 family protein [Spirochaetota bacterium]